MTSPDDMRTPAIHATTHLEQECFFVAPIGEEGHGIRRRSDGILRFIVGRAAEELGLKAVRADEIATPGQITLQVIDHVLGAQAVVADLTGRNPNVFYELAIRHAARLPVALIVDKDDPPLPFDIAQMRAIRFDYRDLESADRCRQAIVAHLREGLAGAVDSPVATSIDLRTLAGGNEVERSVAELVERVEDLARLERRTAGWIRQMTAEFTEEEREFELAQEIDAALEALKEILRHKKDDMSYDARRQLARVETAISWALTIQSTRRPGRRAQLIMPEFLDARDALPLPTGQEEAEPDKVDTESPGAEEVE